MLWYNSTQDNLGKFNVTGSKSAKNRVWSIFFLRRNIRSSFFTYFDYDLRVCSDFDRHLAKVKVTGKKGVKLESSLYLSYGKRLEVLTLHKYCLYSKLGFCHDFDSRSFEKTIGGNVCGHAHSFIYSFLFSLKTMLMVQEVHYI